VSDPTDISAIDYDPALDPELIEAEFGHPEPSAEADAALVDAFLAGHHYSGDYPVHEAEAYALSRPATPPLDVALAAARKAFPDQRFAQVLSNAAGGADTFYWSDEKLIRALREYAALAYPDPET
jgi:hypothetical protein